MRGNEVAEVEEVFKRARFLYETDAEAHARAVRAAQIARVCALHEMGALEYMRALEGAMVAVYLDYAERVTVLDQGEADPLG
jgi:hypothetical protein